MKLLTFGLITAAVITFRSCDEPPPYENIALSLQAEYINGTLQIQPVIINEGSADETIHFNESIAWISEVSSGEESLYGGEEKDQEEGTQILLEPDEVYEGDAVNLDIDPGTYTVTAEAYFFLSGEEEEEQQPYYHDVRQNIEIEGGE
ncbi:hypothetical protein [Alkalicoccus halolimnae]|uniref:Uncharacterized protein n=1 Tax=Alkalicoccus halolimnae TaxID=1667239 RepID=A0A5C7FIE9_9BACI|nr:hypothetical protein [Alkalicoccus halolimnae]TXF83942.1 hypothetical protein FTX54_11670 [Alkalicoccus halolimnae]